MDWVHNSWEKLYTQFICHMKLGCAVYSIYFSYEITVVESNETNKLSGSIKEPHSYTRSYSVYLNTYVFLWGFLPGYVVWCRDDNIVCGITEGCHQNMKLLASNFSHTTDLFVYRILKIFAGGLYGNNSGQIWSWIGCCGNHKRDATR